MKPIGHIWFEGTLKDLRDKVDDAIKEHGGDAMIYDLECSWGQDGWGEYNHCDRIHFELPIYGAKD